ncbi:MAG: DUF4097 and DUF4098 domain-containing protein YvlB [Myxococcota bacterium]|jgi:DUF4097 and DUF4098 domain-containing protein YvlB
MKILALPFLALLFGSCAASETATRPANLNQEVTPQTKALQLVNSNGNITITGLTAGNNINVDADFFAHASSIEKAQALVDDIQIEWSYTSGNAILIEITGVADNCGADLLLQVPEDFNIDIRSTNGNVDVVPLVKGINVRTVNGNIVINSHDKVRAKTSNGNIVYQGNSRDFDLRTVNGNIKVAQSALFDGAGALTSVNGSLSVRNSATIDAKIIGETTNGSYGIYGPDLFEDQGAGLIRLETANGSISITHAEMLK